MNTYQSNGHWVVWLTLMIAIALSIVPLPAWISIARPSWVALILIYWVMVLPERFGLVFAFFSGLMMDLFISSPFGQNAIGLLMVSVIVSSLHRRLRMFPWWQQAFVISLLIGLYQIINLWIRSALEHAPLSSWYLAPAVTSGALWPWISAILGSVKKSAHVQ